LHPDGMADWSHAKTLKSQNAHGVSVIEVELRGAAGTSRWQVRAAFGIRAADYRAHADAHRRSGGRRSRHAHR
jgi:hypothetical protein